MTMLTADTYTLLLTSSPGFPAAKKAGKPGDEATLFPYPYYNAVYIMTTEGLLWLFPGDYT